MGENHEHDADDDYGACFHKVFIFLGAFFVKSAPARIQQNFNAPQFLQTSVYPNASVPHEINKTGRQISRYKQQTTAASQSLPQRNPFRLRTPAATECEFNIETE
jgi:hypothetical protein